MGFMSRQKEPALGRLWVLFVVEQIATVHIDQLQRLATATGDTGEGSSATTTGMPVSSISRRSMSRQGTTTGQHHAALGDVGR